MSGRGFQETLTTGQAVSVAHKAVLCSLRDGWPHWQLSSSGFKGLVDSAYPVKLWLRGFPSPNL